MVAYTYDAMGNLLSAGDGDSELTYSYDAAGRPTGIATGGTAQASAVLAQSYAQFNYDRSGLEAAVGSVARVRGFLHDALRRTRQVDDGVYGALLGSYSFAYDPAGRRAQLGYTPSGKTLDYGYDAADRLVSLGGSAYPGSVAYGYDALGRRTSEERVTATALSVSLALDRETVTDATLLVAGQVAGGITGVAVNGEALALDGAGGIQGTVALSLGYNTLAVTVTDDLGRTASQSTTVELQAPSTDVAVADVVDIAPNGDVYLIEDTGTAAVIGAGSGVVTRPAWLAGAADVALDASGRAYTRRGTELWVHEAGADTLIADLSAVAAGDMGNWGQVQIMKA